MVDGILKLLVDVHNIAFMHKWCKIFKFEIFGFWFYKYQLIDIIIHQKRLSEKINTIQQKLLLCFTTGFGNFLTPTYQIVNCRLISLRFKRTSDPRNKPFFKLDFFRIVIY